MSLTHRDMPSFIEDYNPLPTLILPYATFYSRLVLTQRCTYSITSVIIARSTIALRKFAAHFEQPTEFTHTVLSSPGSQHSDILYSPIGFGYSSIVRLDAECLAADAYLPAPFGSITSIPADENHEEIDHISDSVELASKI